MQRIALVGVMLLATIGFTRDSFRHAVGDLAWRVGTGVVQIGATAVTSAYSGVHSFVASRWVPPVDHQEELVKLLKEERATAAKPKRAKPEPTEPAVVEDETTEDEPVVKNRRNKARTSKDAKPTQNPTVIQVKPGSNRTTTVISD